MSKQTPPAPTASAVGPFPTVIQISRTSGTGSLPSTIAPPDQPLGAMVLGKLPVPGRPIYLDSSRAKGWSGGAMVLGNFQYRGVLQFGLQ